MSIGNSYDQAPRQILQLQIAEYISKGGKITYIPRGQTAIDPDAVKAHRNLRISSEARGR